MCPIQFFFSSLIRQCHTTELKIGPKSVAQPLVQNIFNIYITTHHTIYCFFCFPFNVLPQDSVGHKLRPLDYHLCPCFAVRSGPVPVSGGHSLGPGDLYMGCRVTTNVRNSLEGALGSAAADACAATVMDHIPSLWYNSLVDRCDLDLGLLGPAAGPLGLTLKKLQL